MAKFKKLGPQKTNAITAEIALLGRQGLDINNPNMKYTLKSLDGKLTGLQLVSYMYVGLRKIAPDQAADIDLSKEYNKAMNYTAAELREILSIKVVRRNMILSRLS